MWCVKCEQGNSEIKNWDLTKNSSTKAYRRELNYMIKFKPIDDFPPSIDEMIKFYYLSLKNIFVHPWFIFINKNQLISL